MIKPIPSTYKDVKFRSRLEARWAYYFDLIGLQWQYEPDVYQLKSGLYCPDFLLTGDSFVEIKPNAEGRESVISKLCELSELTNSPCYCLVGNPSSTVQWGYDHTWGLYDVCFTAYAATKWGGPYSGDLGDPEDEPYAHMATNLRFNKGVAMTH